MVKAIACIVLIIGLLKFAQEAPDLFKEIFAAGGDLLKGIDLNPHGQIGRDLAVAGKTAQAGINAGKGIIHGAAAPFKGAAGGIAGAISGGKAGGFTGAMRGMVAGGRAGAGHRGLGGTIQSGQLAGQGAGMISRNQRQAVNDGSSHLSSNMSLFMDRNKTDIENQKEAKKALEARYKDNMDKYVVEHADATNTAMVTAGNNEYIMDRVKKQMAATGQTQAQVTSDTAFMDRVRDDVSRMSDGEKAAYKARKDYEAAFKGDFEREKSNINKKIAELQGENLSDAAGRNAANQALKSFFESQGHWGDNAQRMYNENFNSKMKSDKMDAQVADNINKVIQEMKHDSSIKVAGKDASVALDEKTIRELAKSVSDLGNKTSRTSAEELQFKAQREALSQIMTNMESAAKKTNTNVSMANQVNDIYNPPANNNNSGSGSGS